MRGPVLRPAAAWLAAAAVVVVAALLVVDLGNGVAFADVVERLREIRTLTCRVQQVTVTGDQARTIEDKIYLSEEHGSRSDSHDGSQVVRRFAPLDGPMVTVMSRYKTYIVWKSSGPAGERRARRNRPEDALRRLRALAEDAAAEPLGHRLLEGRKVRGFRIAGLAPDDPMVSAELWVDDDTGLPVKLVYSGPWLQPGTRAQQTFDRFEWNPPLAADLFVPVIPDDYQLVEAGLPPSESNLIRALRIFSELAGGVYPESMDFPRAAEEFDKLLYLRVVDPNPQEWLQKWFVVVSACGFYAQLAAQGSEPEYFGTEVWAEDTDCVLIRWRLDEEQLRVVYGDLRVESVPADEQSRGRCPPRPRRRRPDHDVPQDQPHGTRTWGATFPW